MKHTFRYIDDVAQIIGAEVVNMSEGGIDHFASPLTLLTDSRSFRAGGDSLFFALSTSSGDGHKYIPMLYGRGVRAFVVNRVPEGEWAGAVFFVTDSPLRALQRLGAYARRGMESGKVVGITGSRGKTIVKEWLYAAMKPTVGVMRSPRSYNSQIGVPLSLCGIEGDTHTAIIEAGISCEGEMHTLSDMIVPDIAVFTSLTEEHDEGFDSMRDKAVQKAILAEHADVVVYPADNEYIAGAMAAYTDTRIAFAWSHKDSDAAIFVKEVKALEGGGARITYAYNGREETADIFSADEHDVENAVCVISIMLALGYEPARIACGLRNITPIATRISVSDGVNDCLLAYDLFTSDIDSLESALDFMHRRIESASDHRAATLILSDLTLAPDDDARGVYQRVAEMVKRAGVQRFIGVGEQLSACSSLFADDSLFFRDVSEFTEQLSTSDFNREFILMKGSARYSFEDIVHNLESRTHETVLEVNLDAIVRNFNYFRSFLPSSTGLIAMVKASAYGAGSMEIAKTLQSQGAAYLAVAVVDEGLELRRAGITMPIMVMNPKIVNYRAMFAASLEPEIYDFAMLEDVIREAGKCGLKGYPLHIKLDTGMHRMGFNEEDIPHLIQVLRSTDNVRVATLFSHLATADCPDMDDYTELQLSRFESYTTALMQALPYPIKRHVLNSAGIARYSQRYHYDFARLGIGLYGVNTLPAQMEKPLSPVSTLRTVVIALRERKKGETIGYARRGVLQRDSRIATIPIGYADGMNRKFGNGHVKVLINGRECPTIGNICMDACMIDVTDAPCAVGDSVEIFGENMPVSRLSDVLDTIPYEVLTSVSPRVKRIYFRE